MEHHFRKTCRLCNSTNVVLGFSLVPTPPANAFVSSEYLDARQNEYPLDVYFCENCSHVQLLDIVDPVLLFEDYVYVSGTSPVFVNHFREYAKSLIKDYGIQEGDFVIDIGSNDGTFLGIFKEFGLNTLGVDPAKNIADEANSKGIQTEVGFFSSSLASELQKKYGKANLVTANNVFAHADDLIDIVEGVKLILKDNGIFVFEVSYLGDVIQKTLFDTIYHEHLSYHSVISLQRFFDKLGMELISVEQVDTHGGSIRCVTQRSTGKRKINKNVHEIIKKEKENKLDCLDTYTNFINKIDGVKKELNHILDELIGNGKIIAAYGAPAKATTLMYYFGLDKNKIKYIIDDSPLKQGLYSPGKHIPVLPSTILKKEKPDYLLILAWNFADAIIKNNQEFKKSGGKFITPLPTTRIT